MFLVVLAIGCACAETAPSCRIPATRYHPAQDRNFTNPKGKCYNMSITGELKSQLNVLDLLQYMQLYKYMYRYKIQDTKLYLNSVW